VVRFIVGDVNAAHPRLANVRIVGIVATPGQFPAVGASSALRTSVYVTPAFVRSKGIVPDPADASLAIRLRPGADRDAVISHLADAGLAEVDVTEQAVQTARIQHSIRLEAYALWVLCALISLGACIIIGQSLARQTHLESGDFPTLSALGMSPVQLLGLGLVRAGGIGAVAACVALPIAILLSPLTPIGLAKLAEPRPGILVDAVPLILGALAIPLFTVLVSVLPAWRTAQTMPTAFRGPTARTDGPSVFATTLGRIFGTPSAMVGIRMALQPGRGRAAIPSRSATFAAAVSLAALTASLLFAASLAHVLRTPRLSGYTWDAFVVTKGHGPQLGAALAADRNIVDYARGGFSNFLVGRPAHHVSVAGMVFDGAGRIGPVISAGSAPDADDEIAIGAATLRATHAAIGSTVDVAISDTRLHRKPVRMRVVGTAILPPDPYAVTGAGEGVAVTVAGLRRMDPQTAAQRADLPYLVRFAPGVRRDAGLAAVSNDAQGLDPFIVGIERPASVTSLARISEVPLLLSGSLVLLAAASFAHVLFSSTRRRRRELAVLQALGFVRAQLRRAIAWQATTLAAGALLIGLPVGVLGGRLAWQVSAQQLGVLPEPVVPLTALLAVVPSTLALAILISAVPGHAAARTKPGAALRDE
jgi:ABC-type lipoprotein release transport system permease subunit